MSNTHKNAEVSKTSLLDITITDLAAGGKGVGRFNGKVVFVEKGMPGQRVLVQLYKDRKDYAEGRVVELLENSPVYEEPKCSHFAVCGGCSLQNIRYEEQLKYKRQWIVEALERIGGLASIPVQETVPSPDHYFYRNKMEFSFSDKVWDGNAKKIKPNQAGLGLHLSGRYDTVVNIEKCFLQSDISSVIVRLVREFALKSGLPAYSSEKYRGFWRFLIIREGKMSGEWLLNIITNTRAHDDYTIIVELADIIRNEIPEIAAFFHAVHSGRSHAATWNILRKIFGADSIQERIGKYKFNIDCGTFFQTNTLQAENLYEIVKNAGDFTGDETVYDLYSGAGTIPVYLSGAVKHIIGMELEQRSVEAAQKNAELNTITNCRFIQGKVRTLIKYPPELFGKYGKPDVVITNPTRSGMDQKTLERVIKLDAARIVYVSCNPATLARDLSFLSGTYRIERIVPVDMFPHTAHIESVASLTKKHKG